MARALPWRKSGPDLHLSLSWLCFNPRGTLETSSRCPTEWPFAIPRLFLYSAPASPCLQPRPWTRKNRSKPLKSSTHGRASSARSPACRVSGATGPLPAGSPCVGARSSGLSSGPVDLQTLALVGMAREKGVNVSWRSPHVRTSRRKARSGRRTADAMSRGGTAVYWSRNIGISWLRCRNLRSSSFRVEKHWNREGSSFRMEVYRPRLHIQRVRRGL